MKIGEVIREYRKKKNITQEEMANRLGVTAPAVNKWENGNSQPDIMLLAPIARLLNTTLDTLLSFEEEQELIDITVELSKDIEEVKLSCKVLPAFGICIALDSSMPSTLMKDYATMAMKTI